MPAEGFQRAFLLVMELDYKKLSGLVPAVIQDDETGCVLMLGYMNDEAFRKTVETRNVTFFSRSRNRLWLKGESSGHRLIVKEIVTDCDQDALLIRVEAPGPASAMKDMKVASFGN